MQEIKAMSTEDMLRLREDATDELTYRLETHLEQLFCKRDPCKETGDPFAFEEVANEIIEGEAWQGEGVYVFFTFEKRWPQQSFLFKRYIIMPEALAEELYTACTLAHAWGTKRARAGENVGCNKVDNND